VVEAATASPEESLLGKVFDGISRFPHVFLAAIVIVGFLLRVLYIRQAAADPFFQNPIIDARFYDGWALKILGGDWIGEEAYYQDPLFAYFLAAIYKLFGHSFAAVRVIQAGIDSATLALLYFIGRELFDVRVGLLSAALGALYGPMVCSTGLLDKTTLTIFLTALPIAVLVWAQDRGWKSCRLVGFLLGLDILTRGNMLAVTLGIGLWLAFGRGMANLHVSVKRGMAVVLGAGLVVGLVTLRNYLVSGDVVLLSSNAGLNFFIGNNPLTAGNYVEPPFLHGIPEKEYADSKAVAGRVIDKASEVSRFWLGQGLGFIRHQPMKWLALMGRKVWLLFISFEIPETYSFYYFRDQYSALSVAFLNWGIIFPLALLGAVTCLIRRRGGVILIFSALYVVSVVLFFITSRYRAPLAIPILVLAAAALAELGAMWRDGAYRSAVARAAFLAVLLGLVHWTPAWMRRHVIAPGLSTPHATLGLMLSEAGDLSGALNALRKASAIHPDSATFAYMANCHNRLGDTDQAILEYHQALRMDPMYVEAYNNLGVLYYKKGDYQAALKAFESAMKLQPDDPEIAKNYANVSKLTRRNLP